MCFSATASFIASITLVTAGGLLIRRTKTKRHLLIAVIPCIFGLQQAAEGFVWLGLPDADFAARFFLFFAFIFWPAWIPLAMWTAETDPQKKQWIAFFGGIGVMVGLVYGSLIPITHAMNHGCSIQYFQVPEINNATTWVSEFGYLIAGVIPVFISSLKRLKFLGILSILSALITSLIVHYQSASLWCFFSAIITLGLFWALPKTNQN